MSTVRDLIKGSMRLLGALSTGETPSADELSEGLFALNDMVESWSTEGLIIPTMVREAFTLTAGTQTYTMGTGGSFNTTRPLVIEGAALEDQSATPKLEIPVAVLTPIEWAALPLKTMSSTLPTKLYAEGTSPLETVNIWPNPTVANKLVIYSRKAISSFAGANTTISLPPGYFRALKYNLAIEWAPEFGKDPSAVVVAIAERSLANIKRKNKRPRFLKVDDALMGKKTWADWRTGD